MAFLNNKAISICVVLEFMSLEPVETKIPRFKLDFSIHILTFLMLGEGQAIINVMNALKRSPDVFMINAQGMSHPNRCVCPFYIGVKTSKPTVGVAQTRLFGFCLKDPVEAGLAVPLTFAGEQIGWVLKSRMGTRSIFI